MGKDVMVALDFKSGEEALNFLDQFTGKQLYVKVGMELYYAEGPSIIREIKKRGHKLFLDLKLHDIPNTVEKAMAVLSRLDVDMLTVSGHKIHAPTRPLLIAVTQLTSTSQERMQKELLIPEELDQVVIQYAKNAAEAGLDGVVCSPLESGKIHEACGSGFLTVTPGVRFDDASKGDQVRVTTPAKAKELGSDYIVVGRPITQAEDPVAAYERCVSEFVNA